MDDFQSSTEYTKDPSCSMPSAPPQQSYSPYPINATSQLDHGPWPPPSHGLNNHSPVEWSSGLFGCCQDFSSCCLTCCCPCVAFGRIAEIVDRGSTSCGVSGALYALFLFATGCSCLYSCFYRSKMRGQYFLEERPCTDCCVHCCCEGCALCQEYRELENIGFDMSIGWHGNMERQKKATMMPPTVHKRMGR